MCLILFSTRLQLILVISNGSLHASKIRMRLIIIKFHYMHTYRPENHCKIYSRACIFSSISYSNRPAATNSFFPATKNDKKSNKSTLLDRCTLKPEIHRFLCLWSWIWFSSLLLHLHFYLVRLFLSFSHSFNGPTIIFTVSLAFNFFVRFATI